MLEMINGWPLAVKIIVTILAVVWAIEIYLLPFKFNIYANRQKDIEQLLRQIFATVSQEKAKQNIRKSQIIDNMFLNITEKGEGNETRNEKNYNKS